MNAKTQTKEVGSSRFVYELSHYPFTHSDDSDGEGEDEAAETNNPEKLKEQLL